MALGICEVKPEVETRRREWRLVRGRARQEDEQRGSRRVHCVRGIGARKRAVRHHTWAIHNRWLLLIDP